MQTCPLTGGGGEGSTPSPQLIRVFFLTGEKDAECSETLKYVFGMFSSKFEFFTYYHSESIDIHIEK